LAFLAGLSTILFLRKRKRIIFIIIIIFIISLTLLPRPGGEGVKLERVASFIQRVENWQTAINIWKNYSIFGVGFNNYRYAQHKLGFLIQPDWKITHAGAGVDNSFLFVLVTSGIIGEILFLNFWLRVLVASKSRLVVGSLVAVFVHSLFINSLFYPWVMIWVWFLLDLPIKEYKKH
jgi:O-antigen ligase